MTVNLAKDLDEDDVYDTLMQEIEDNFESDILQVASQAFGSVSNQYVKDETKPRYVIAYLFEDDHGPNLDFKALSVDNLLKDDFVFLSISDPIEQIRGEFATNKLPTINGVMRDNEQYDAGAVFNLGGLEEVEFISLRRTLLQLIPDKLQEINK